MSKSTSDQTDLLTIATVRQFVHINIEKFNFPTRVYVDRTLSGIYI